MVPLQRLCGDALLSAFLGSRSWVLLCGRSIACSSRAGPVQSRLHAYSIFSSLPLTRICHSTAASVRTKRGWCCLLALVQIKVMFDCLLVMRTQVRTIVCCFNARSDSICPLCVRFTVQRTTCSRLGQCASTGAGSIGRALKTRICRRQAAATAAADFLGALAWGQMSGGEAPETTLKLDEV